MRGHGAALLGAVTLLLLLPSAALGCPDCAIGRAARGRVWSDDFVLHAVTALLPFLVIAVLCIWIERDRTEKKS